MADIEHVTIKGVTYDIPGAAVSSVNGQTGNVVLDADDVGALPDSTAIPTKTSDLTNDSGFITTETDPTVPSWAKASSKPTYTASEVGALPDTTSIPENTSDLNNDSGFITINDVDGSYLPLTAGSSNALTSDLYVQGDVHRTPQTYSASPASSTVSLTAGNQKLCEISNISAGVYIITAAIHFTASSNPGVAFVNLYKSSTASNTIMYSQHHVGRSSCYFNDTTWATFGDGASCSFYFEPNVTGTANAVVLSMIRIA